MKETYISLMDRILDAYSHEHILRYFEAVKQEGIREHGFPRLTANLGILIANGRRCAYTDLFIQMMDTCCESFLKPKIPGLGNDFSVKEIIFCLLEVEQANCVPKEKTAYWRSLLARIEPSACYNVFAVSREDNLHNWALFTAVSEHMRQFSGLADTNAFVDLQLATQMKRLDENGMYQDPNNPIVYDLAPRGLFSVLMHFGYHGEFYDAIDTCLQKAGLLTLQMQSVTGEIPYGGRSNQFLHNESTLAQIMEFEANRYAALGNLQLAGQFKAGARKALENIKSWLDRKQLTHIKNNYPLDTQYGCEGYAYFDKYMVTAASFLYVSYLFCNDTIAEYPLPEKAEAFSLPPHFHKSFLRNQNWFVEMDTDADFHYDANGIGRIHRAGAPASICLSTPGTATPNYTTAPEMLANFAIAAGIEKDGQLIFATDPGVTYTKTGEAITEDTASVSMLCDFGGKTAGLDCLIAPTCVKISVSAEGKAALMLPAFAFDGKEAVQITCRHTVLEIQYQKYLCRYTADGPILDLDKRGMNRNGEYRLFCAQGTNHVSVTVEIEPF